MREYLPLKLICWALLLVIFTAMTHGMCETAHAAQVQPSVTCDQAAQSELFASDHCPCCPVEQNDHQDGCDACINCICHASLTLQQFRLTYTPFIIDLKPSRPFKQLPEVYLSKFIPPQNLA